MPGLHIQSNPITLEGDYEDVISWIDQNCNKVPMMLFTYYETVLMRKSDEFLNSIHKLKESMLPNDLQNDTYFKIALLAVLEGCNYHTEMEKLEFELEMHHWVSELTSMISRSLTYSPFGSLRDLDEFRKRSKLLIIPKIDKLIDEFISKLNS